MTHEAMSWRRQVRDQEREGEQRLACLVCGLVGAGLDIPEARRRRNIRQDALPLRD